MCGPGPARRTHQRGKGAPLDRREETARSVAGGSCCRSPSHPPPCAAQSASMLVLRKLSSIQHLHVLARWVVSGRRYYGAVIQICRNRHNYGRYSP